MKHFIIRILPLILLLCLSFSMVSCAPADTADEDEKKETSPPVETQREDTEQLQQTEQERFDEFLQQDFIDEITADTLTLHMTLRNPEDYGITDHEVSWGDYLDVGPSEESIQEGLDRIEEFRTFDRTLLTQEQQESYDIYSFYVEMFDPESTLYYYGNAFQGRHGPQYWVPIVLSEYQFSRKEDVDDFLVLCSQIDLMFDANIRFEKAKSEKGLFMSDKLADDAIKACSDYISKKENNVLLLSFKERLDEIDFLTDEEKAEYISRNEEIFYDVVVPAYETVIEELELLKGTGKNDKGMAHFEKGKEHYIKRLRSMGITKTPEELIDFCDQKLEEIFQEYVRMIRTARELEEI